MRWHALEEKLQVEQAFQAFKSVYRFYWKGVSSSLTKTVVFKYTRNFNRHDIVEEFEFEDDVTEVEITQMHLFKRVLVKK